MNLKGTKQIDIKELLASRSELKILLGGGSLGWVSDP